MYEITTEESKAYKLPPLNFRGSPTGIDIRKVIETQVLPIINTGIAHKDALEAFVNLLEDEGLLED